jgi:hypothetical protein
MNNVINNLSSYSNKSTNANNTLIILNPVKKNENKKSGGNSSFTGFNNTNSFNNNISSYLNSSMTQSGKMKSKNSNIPVKT